MTLRAERCDPAEVREAWSALAAASGNVFATPELAEIWWQHFGRDRSSLLLSARNEGGELLGLLPLFRERRRGVRVLRFVGAGPADELGPVCSPEVRAEVLASLRVALGRERHDVFLGEQLGADAELLLGGRRLSQEGSPVARAPEGGWEEWLSARSRNFREQVRRRERRLFGQQDAGFRAGRTERLDAELDVLFALHRAGRPHGSSFLAAEPFHRAFAHAAAARGWLRLWFLEVDGEPRAAWQGFRFGGVESYYQAGRDPDWDHASVGFVLLAHTIREAFGEGIAEYRLLRGGESYKYRFADGDPGLVTIGRGATPVGVAALAGARAARRLRRLLAPDPRSDRRGP